MILICREFYANEGRVHIRSGLDIEFTKMRTWQCNPLLHLQITFIGLDYALAKPCTGPDERFERTMSR